MKPRPSSRHPGAVLKEYVAGLPVSAAAQGIGVSRSTLSRILSGRSRISSDVAVRLSDALGTSTTLWDKRQLDSDLYGQSKLAVKQLQKKSALPKRTSDRRSKGLTPTSSNRMASTDVEQVIFANEIAQWDASPPVGREFGSPDYERLEDLDRLAFEVFGSMIKARRWLDTPHPELGEISPEDAARSRTGNDRVMRLMRKTIKAKK